MSFPKVTKVAYILTPNLNIIHKKNALFGIIENFEFSVLFTVTLTKMPSNVLNFE